MTEKTVELNRNQELVLQWLKDDLKDDSDEKNTLRSLFYLQKFGCCQDNEVVEAHKTLNVSQFMEVVKEFADWTLSDHQTAFAVGEYYVYNITIFKVLENADRYLKTLELTAGKLREDGFYKSGRRYTQSTTATAEQIATFKRAEHFASKGRELDEFRVGDKVSIVGTDEIIKIDSLRGDSGFGGVSDLGNYFIISTPPYYEVNLIQTAEELQEVGE